MILIHLIGNISVLVSQGQDTFAFGEALTDTEVLLREFSYCQKTIICLTLMINELRQVQ
jgi:hypothetical protein